MEMIDLVGKKANVAFVDMYGILRPELNKDCEVVSFNQMNDKVKIRIAKAPAIDFQISVDLDEIENFLGGFTGTIIASSYSPSTGIYTNVMISK